jgi:hypothetical protein
MAVGRAQPFAVAVLAAAAGAAQLVAGLRAEVDSVFFACFALTVACTGLAVGWPLADVRPSKKTHLTPPHASQWISHRLAFGWPTDLKKKLVL